MADPIVVPELQFCDANGNPYAGGSIATYIPGTDTAKSTYLDPGLTALNTNPVILDAAGRSLMYGDGDYRLVLRDSVGNLIWDVQCSTIASAAMAPVVGAPTIAAAQALLGIADFASEIAALQSQVNGLQSQINTINSKYFVGTTGPNISLQSGASQTDADGHKRVTYDSPFGAGLNVMVLCTAENEGFNSFCCNVVAAPDVHGFDVWIARYSSGSYVAAGIVGFTWVAVVESA